MSAEPQRKPIATIVQGSLDDERPLSPEEFAWLMKPFALADGGRVALAISGGPDSMALAWSVIAARRWYPMAFIVDHRLRPESGAEAKQTKQRLEAMGYRAEILGWDHPPVTTRVHVEARKARYSLLIKACKQYDIRDLLFAHQLEDQAETILMRFAKGSGLDGLAGMPRESTVDGVRLLRPLLDVSKKRLLATCVANKVGYATDPSNGAIKYARGRLRRVQSMLAEEGFTPERLIDLGDRASEAKDALEHYTRALLRVAVSMDLTGVIRFNLEQLHSAPRAVALRALAACLQVVHAAEYPPERATLMPLLEALRNDKPMSARTLHGCVITKGATAATIIREPAAVTEEKPIKPGETILWDGRWQVTLAKECEKKNLVVRALGAQTHAFIDELAHGLRHKVPQGRARAVLPALWEGAALTIIPDFFEHLSTPMARAEVASRF